MTDDGLQVIASLPGLKHLQISCLATRKGLETLAQAPRLRGLTIASPHLTDEMVEHVRDKYPSLTSLRLMEFRLGGSTVSRSTSALDGFWRQGAEEERKELNALEGEPAPALAATRWINVDEGTELADFRGKVVLVEFWGTWCGPCLARMPEVRQLHDEYGKRGLIVVGVHSTRAAEDAADYVTTQHIPWAIAIDDNNQSSTAYAVPHWPSCYLVDRRGVLRMANPYKGDLEAAIQGLLNE